MEAGGQENILKHTIMCLIIYCKTRKEALELKKTPLIAQEDMKVWKELFNDSPIRGWSPYRVFRYDKGYHYYRTGMIFGSRVEYSWFNEKHSLVVNAGLHSYFKRPSNGRYILMVVPKGAKYYISGGEMVSSDLIWY